MDITESIKTAKLQLEVAESRFNNALEDEEIDAAISEMNAAKKRLNRLLKIVKGKAS